MFDKVVYKKTQICYVDGTIQKNQYKSLWCDDPKNLNWTFCSAEKAVYYMEGTSPTALLKLPLEDLFSELNGKNFFQNKELIHEAILNCHHRNKIDRQYTYVALSLALVFFLISAVILLILALAATNPITLTIVAPALASVIALDLLVLGLRGLMHGNLKTGTLATLFSAPLMGVLMGFYAGTFIFPGLGTVMGLIIGAASGLLIASVCIIIACIKHGQLCSSQPTLKDYFISNFESFCPKGL